MSVADPFHEGSAAELVESLPENPARALIPPPTSEVEGILSTLSVRRVGEDLDLVRRAHAFATKAHEGQHRISGEPYITHPVAVATIIADLGLDTVSAAAALLHDAVEDTGASLAQIEAEFGPAVAAIVDGVTKLDRLRFDSKEAQQAATMRKMLVAMAKRLARARHQARGPAPQHADPVGDAGVEAAADRRGDAGHLRAARAPPRDPGSEVAAGGPCLRDAPPEAVRRDRPDGGHPRSAARSGACRGPRGSSLAPRRGRDRSRGHRAPEEPLEHLREDGRAGQGVRRDPRSRRDPSRRRPPRRTAGPPSGRCTPCGRRCRVASRTTSTPRSSTSTSRCTRRW